MSSVGSFFSYVNDARSHEPEGVNKESREKSLALERNTPHCIQSSMVKRQLSYPIRKFFENKIVVTPRMETWNLYGSNTRVGTLIVATIYLQLIQNRYMFRSFTVPQCSHQHCVQPIASDVEVVGYL